MYISKTGKRCFIYIVIEILLNLFLMKYSTMVLYLSNIYVDKRNRRRSVGSLPITDTPYEYLRGHPLQ